MKHIKELIKEYMKTIKASPIMYVDMYLSGQIEECEWITILQENSEVKREYKKILRERR